MRDIDATKDAILGAAEALFAKRGYEGASLQDIATAAGVSRGMPGYAFGSKRKLYEAVLERAFAQPRALAAELPAALGREDPEAALRAAVGSYIDFLAQHPTYVRLLQRAALDDSGGVGGAPADDQGLVEGLYAATSLLDVAGVPGIDPRQLLVSAIALCFFPLAHDNTLLRPLGLDGHDPGFLAERKAHVVDLLLSVLHDGASPEGGDLRPRRRPRTKRR